MIFKANVGLTLKLKIIMQKSIIYLDIDLLHSTVHQLF